MPNNDILRLLDESDTTVAVVGATDNPSKYGYVIYRDLKRKGFTVFPVNPNRESVDGDESFPTLEDLPSRPTIINLVVPPKVALGVIEQCQTLGWKNVWLQPGAESPETLRYLQEHGFNYLANACIMVASRSHPKKR